MSHIRSHILKEKVAFPLDVHALNLAWAYVYDKHDRLYPNNMPTDSAAESNEMKTILKLSELSDVYNNRIRELLLNKFARCYALMHYSSKLCRELRLRDANFKNPMDICMGVFAAFSKNHAKFGITEFSNADKQHLQNLPWFPFDDFEKSYALYFQYKLDTHS